MPANDARRLWVVEADIGDGWRPCGTDRGLGKYKADEICNELNTEDPEDEHRVTKYIPASAVQAAVEAERERLMPYARLRLLDLMREISEEFYAAGWLNTLEYDLWGMVVGERGLNYGMGEVDSDTVDELRSLSEITGGWFMRGCGRETFVDIEDWKAHYAAHTIREGER